MALSKLCVTIGFGSRRDGNMHVPYDITRGLRQFNNCGVGNIILAPFIGVQLEDSKVKLEVPVTEENDSGSDGASSSASCSGGSNNDLHESDQCDRGKFSKTCVEEQKAVKVNQVNLGSFAHGFGLREHDIILTVNDVRVESAKMANFLVNKTVGINKNSKLAMEIQRIERGLIRLDNQGDEIEVEAIEDLICISGLDDHQQQKYRLKHVRYRKYLTVRSRNICLSRRNTNERETYFVVYQYEKHLDDSSVDQFIMLKHEASGKCLYVENGRLILKDLPQPVTRLPENSPYLFNMKTSSNTEAFFEAITSPDMAIGFKKPRRKAELLHEPDEKNLFYVFEV